MRILSYFCSIFKEKDETKLKDLKDNLKGQLTQFLREKGCVDEQQRAKYISLVVDWLENADHIALADAIQDKNGIDETLLEELSTQALLFLVNQKTEEFSAVLDNFFQDKLPTIVEEMMQHNLD